MTTIFKPTNELTFDTVVENRDELCKSIKSSQSDQFCLDLSQVSHCDSAGLALLIEAKKLCEKSAKSFALSGMSIKTKSLAEFCGVNSLLS